MEVCEVRHALRACSAVAGDGDDDQDIGQVNSPVVGQRWLRSLDQTERQLIGFGEGVVERPVRSPFSHRKREATLTFAGASPCLRHG
jgi:hypothetical protein